MPHPDCPYCQGAGTYIDGAYDHETGTYDAWDAPCTCDASQPPPEPHAIDDDWTEAPF